MAYRLVTWLIILLVSVPALGWGTLEDFTSGWTHVDTGNTLDVTTNALTDNTYVSEGTGAYHTKSYGSGYFGDFSIRWYGQADASCSAWSDWYMGFANEVDYWPGVVDAGDSLWVRIRCDGTAGNQVADIVSVDDGTPTNSDDISIGTEGTNYYFQFERSGTTATLTIWTVGYGDTLVDTVNLTATNTTFTYCHAYNIRSDDDGNVHWRMNDLDLTGPAGGSAVPAIQAGHRRRR